VRGEDRFGTRREAITPEEIRPSKEAAWRLPVLCGTPLDQLRAVTKGNAGRALLSHRRHFGELLQGRIYFNIRGPTSDRLQFLVLVQFGSANLGFNQKKTAHCGAAR
jgi:hypothetical protein